MLKKLPPCFWQSFKNWPLDLLCEGSLFSGHYNPLAGKDAFEFLLTEAKREKGLTYLLNTTWATCPIAYLRHAIHALTQVDFCYLLYLWLDENRANFDYTESLQCLEVKIKERAEMVLPLLTNCVSNIAKLQNMACAHTLTQNHLYQQFVACLGLVDFLGLNVEHIATFLPEDFRNTFIEQYNKAMDWLVLFTPTYERVIKSYIPDFPNFLPNYPITE